MGQDVMKKHQRAKITEESGVYVSKQLEITKIQNNFVGLNSQFKSINKHFFIVL